MSAYHKPVLLKEVLDLLQPSPGRTYVDGTAGGGTAAEALARKLAPGGTLVLLDQDDEALSEARTRLEGIDIQLIIERTNFRRMATVLALRGIGQVDGIMLDLGVSSHQLDTAERGFSFRFDADLDMRMDRSKGETAADLLATRSERELSQIFRTFGEIPWADRIARNVIHSRAVRTIRSTGDFAELVVRSAPAAARSRDIHPATLAFQALRIAVNDELGALEQVLADAPRLLKPGGRIAILSYHSLEDRLVKQKFVEYAGKCTCPPKFPVCVCGAKKLFEIETRKAVSANDAEVADNPRARSARLRCAMRTEKPL